MESQHPPVPPKQDHRYRVQSCSTPSPFPTLTLTHLCLLLGPLQNDRDGWNPSVCMNFCAAFLSFAQNTVVQDDPR